MGRRAPWVIDTQGGLLGHQLPRGQLVPEEDADSNSRRNYQIWKTWMFILSSDVTVSGCLILLPMSSVRAALALRQYPSYWFDPNPSGRPFRGTLNGAAGSIAKYYYCVVYIVPRLRDRVQATPKVSTSKFVLGNAREHLRDAGRPEGIKSTYVL